MKKSCTELKRSIFSISRFALILLVFAASSCAPEEEEPTPVDDRDKFVSANGWSCQENSSQTGASTFTVHITKSSSNTAQIQLENFYNYGFQNKAIASVNGSSFTIASQQISGNTVQGSGTLQSNGSITMNYTVNTGSAIDTCTAVMTKL
jgi:hypothetical protein